jgi:hypothetical protein
MTQGELKISITEDGRVMECPRIMSTDLNDLMCKI